MSDQAVRDYFTNTISLDFLRLICGDVLGEGVARTVYACRIDASSVIKFETPAESFHNVIEWETWQEVRDMKEVARWLAPCVAISPCGSILIQKRTEPISRNKLPKKMPRFLTDYKASNYGLIENRVVCHDYGFGIRNYTISTALRRADWRID